ncbi:MAG: serine hydrolase [Prevotellaceae bacterium]|jgi:beta-glucosidase-like glycosyl hydrolase/CubicO group peptidase (beta-lactamase class C family)|nr:serine hydrolase [Prevotellaceae bacterium]
MNINILKNSSSYICVILACLLFSGEIAANSGTKAKSGFSEKAWVDSLMQKLTLRQRIAQLFMVAVTPDAENAHYKRVVQTITKEQVGGVIAMRGNVATWVRMINQLQALSAIPLFTAVDGEYGVGMRLEGADPFPRQMQLGALTGDEYIYEMGKAVAAQCRRLGIYMNFAPVADINNNPDNPVINIRSFGEDKYKVAQKSITYMRGMQAGGILTCAKHFPGHGDTDKDSHDELPSIHHERARIDALELYPFKTLINAGIDAVMVAHLRVAAIDAAERPASLSALVIQQLLRTELGYNGLVFTDALNMRGVLTGVYQDSVCLLALQAGNDILLMPDDVTGSINLIEKAVKKGEISETVINAKCRKMLETKAKILPVPAVPVSANNLLSDLNPNTDEVLRLRIADASITLLSNKNNFLPLQGLDKFSIAYLEIGKGLGTAFKQYLDYYAPVAGFAVDALPSAQTLDSLYLQLKPYNLIIAGFHGHHVSSQSRFGIDSALVVFLERLAVEKNVVVDLFRLPYALTKFEYANRFAAIIVSYQNIPANQQRSAQLIFGAIRPKGKLPVSVYSYPSFIGRCEEGWGFPVGTGLSWPAPIRLKYVIPEEIGINRQQLIAVDLLMQEAIDKQATPGGQIIAAYKGQVFYHKTFGRHTYDNNSQAVRWNDSYDLASLTKVTATLPVVMHLVNEQKVNIDKRLGDYLQAVSKYKDKQQLKLMDILTHQSGLPAFQPFHHTFVIDGKFLNPNEFRVVPTANFNIPVATGIYTSKKIPDYIYKEINSATLMNKVYRYSDWGFIYLQQMAEAIIRQRLDHVAERLFYAPLGMNYTAYRPLERFAAACIVPTERDTYFRMQLLQGYVHDPTAALLGGVAGHAGLFGNANDMAKILQMYLNKGSYGGTTHFHSAIVERFTACPYCNNGNRRGLGFDKPEMNPTKNSPVGREASADSYGHSGYTGTFCWVDPQRELIYVFLSNRVYPSDDKKLNSLDTRSRILTIFSKIIDGL